jgi:hypothetical protein
MSFKSNVRRIAVPLDDQVLAMRAEVYTAPDRLRA